MSKITLKSTALCPCQSGLHYGECCGQYHQQANAPSAEALMRSRYCAFVLRDIDYIIRTTAPAQQDLLDAEALSDWAQNTQWSGLEIVQNQTALSPKTSPVQHSRVAFNAFFMQQNQKQVHHENSLFVQIEGVWYFVDPTVPLPSNKQPCLCGSGKKFKHCCGGFLT